MKRSYSKGSIKKVRLVPEEAVLASCKNHMQTGGPSNYMGMCHDMYGTFCSAFGS